MTIRLLTIAVLAFGLSVGMVSAKTFPVAGDNPVATVTIPDKWSPSEYDDGVEATSPDEGFYIAFESVELSDVSNAIVEGVKFFKKQGVKINPDSINKKDDEVAGIKGVSVMMQGTDKTGPTTVMMTVLPSANHAGRALMLYGWGSDKAFEANHEAVTQMISSLQMTK